MPTKTVRLAKRAPVSPLQRDHFADLYGRQYQRQLPVRPTVLPVWGTAAVFNGCIPLTDSDMGEAVTDPGPVLSSPIIGENANIYVTTAKGLYVIK